MHPKNLALLVTLLPILACNGVYLLSAAGAHVSWCVPYLEGCTSISRAARLGPGLWWFKLLMIAYGILMIGLWQYAQRWLDSLREQQTRTGRLNLALGVSGSLALIVYIIFLGSDGAMYNFMRRAGVLVYFFCIPLAQLLLLNQHYKLTHERAGFARHLTALRFQTTVLILLLLIAIASLISEALQIKTQASENVVEWNFSLLMTLYFAALGTIWKK
ncbi:MAG: hypothetical protein HKN88_02840 [Gammaproteobacteria bacterium]|nr:hypothetical protein [Gammaproteobacteria bacterium]NNM13764.1 hypothetical protein [Gammaproteobacteria bacterium]